MELKQPNVNVYSYDYNSASLLKGLTWDQYLYQALKREVDRNASKEEVPEFVISAKALLSEVEVEGEYNDGAFVDVFCQDLTLEFAFAKDLHIYDIINSGCFIPISDIGGHFLKHLDYFDCMVYRKSYYTPKDLSIDFILLESGTIDQVINKNLFNGLVADV